MKKFPILLTGILAAMTLASCAQSGVSSATPTSAPTSEPAPTSETSSVTTSESSVTSETSESSATSEKTETSATSESSATTGTSESSTTTGTSESTSQVPTVDSYTVKLGSKTVEMSKMEGLSVYSASTNLVKDEVVLFYKNGTQITSNISILTSTPDNLIPGENGSFTIHNDYEAQPDEPTIALMVNPEGSYTVSAKGYLEPEPENNVKLMGSFDGWTTGLPMGFATGSKTEYVAENVTVHAGDTIKVKNGAGTEDYCNDWKRDQGDDNAFLKGVCYLDDNYNAKFRVDATINVYYESGTEGVTYGTYISLKNVISNIKGQIYVDGEPYGETATFDFNKYDETGNPFIEYMLSVDVPSGVGVQILKGSEVREAGFEEGGAGAYFAEDPSTHIFNYNGPEQIITFYVKDYLDGSKAMVYADGEGPSPIVEERVIKIDTSKLDVQPSENTLFAYTWDDEGNNELHTIAANQVVINASLENILVGIYGEALPEDLADFEWRKVSKQSVDLTLDDFRSVFSFKGTETDGCLDAEMIIDQSLIIEASDLTAIPTIGEPAAIPCSSMEIIRDSELGELALAYQYYVEFTANTKNASFALEIDGKSILTDLAFFEVEHDDIVIISDNKLVFQQNGVYDIYIKVATDGSGLVSLYLTGHDPLTAGYYLYWNEEDPIRLGDKVDTELQTTIIVDDENTGVQNFVIKDETGAIVTGGNGGITLDMPGSYTFCYRAGEKYTNGPTDNTYVYYKLYFTDNQKWGQENISVYLYNGENNNGWPGNSDYSVAWAKTDEFGDEVYEITPNANLYAKENSYMIFSNKGNGQTVDINICDALAETGTKGIYIDNQSARLTLDTSALSFWGEANARTYAYVFDDEKGTSAWIEMTETEADSNLYVSQYINLSEYKNVIFVRCDPSKTPGWDAKWTQTVNLTLPNAVSAKISLQDNQVEGKYTAGDWYDVKNGFGVYTYEAQQPN